MKRVKILRDGAIGDPGNVRASVVRVKEGEIVELSDTAADMAVNESNPPRAEYIDGKSEPGYEGSGDDERENKDEGSGDERENKDEGNGDGGEPGSGDNDKVSLIDRLTGKGKGESSVLE